MFHLLYRFKVKTIVLLILIVSFLVTKIYYYNFKGIDKNLPILLWWTPFSIDREINCSKSYSCLVSSNRKLKNHTSLSAYLFYGSHFDPTDLPVDLPKVPWSIFHEESPKNLGLILHEDGQSIFDIASTFDRHSDLPLTLQYLKDLKSLTDNQYYVSLRIKNTLLKKNAPILYIQSHCNTPIERDKIVSELMNYVDVDSYGNCLNNKKLPENLKLSDDGFYEYDESLMKFVASYKFILAIENAQCEDYITEKLWRPLIVGSIPIYLGSPTVRDWLPNNKSAILIDDFENIELLSNYIKQVNENDILYNSYLDHKEHRTLDLKIKNNILINALKKGDYGMDYGQNDVIPSFECFVCEKVQSKFKIKKNKRHSIYNCLKPKSKDLKNPNWWINHWKQGYCEAKVLRKLLEKRKNYTKEDFEGRINYFMQRKLC